MLARGSTLPLVLSSKIGARDANSLRTHPWTGPRAISCRGGTKSWTPVSDSTVAVQATPVLCCSGCPRRGCIAPAIPGADRFTEGAELQKTSQHRGLSFIRTDRRDAKFIRLSKSVLLSSRETGALVFSFLPFLMLFATSPVNALVKRITNSIPTASEVIARASPRKVFRLVSIR